MEDMDLKRKRAKKGKPRQAATRRKTHSHKRVGEGGIREWNGGERRRGEEEEREGGRKRRG